MMSDTARSRLTPWTDRAGRFSWLKAITFAGLFLPALAAAYLLFTGAYRAEPAKGVNHELGLWAFRFLLLSLAVTPAMQIFRYTRLILVRRMIGVAAFVYALSHLCAYAVMENLDLPKVVSEILLRIYLTIGFATLLLLSLLAATAFDSAVKRLGAKAWGRLHRLTYLAATLAVIHYFMQTKLVVTEPSVFAGLFLWLMLYRFVLWSTRPRVAMRVSTVFLVSIAAVALTIALEAAGYALFTHIDALRVFQANFTPLPGWRPSWYVAIFGAAVTVMALAYNLISPPAKRT